MASKLPTVAIIGQANVGKSSLFNRMVRAQQAIVAREAGTTRDNVLGRVEHNYHTFWLVDTAGLKDPNDEFGTGCYCFTFLDTYYFQIFIYSLIAH